MFNPFQNRPGTSCLLLPSKLDVPTNWPIWPVTSQSPTPCWMLIKLPAGTTLATPILMSLLWGRKTIVLERSRAWRPLCQARAGRPSTRTHEHFCREGVRAWHRPPQPQPMADQVGMSNSCDTVFLGPDGPPTPADDLTGLLRCHIGEFLFGTALNSEAR